MKSPRNWTVRDRRAIFDHPVLTAAQVIVEAEANDGNDPTQRERLVLESNDWVNVIAIDTSSEPTAIGASDSPRIVLIRQWRFGVGSQTLEIPGGLVDTGEDPATAARRELLEGDRLLPAAAWSL